MFFKRRHCFLHILISFIIGVFIALRWFHRSALFSDPLLSNRPVRIYCLILTTPEFWTTRARPVESTWAPRCDHHVFISEMLNTTTDLPIAPLMNITSGHRHLTQKMSLALSYVYEQAIDDYNWFVKADDDTYLFVENLRLFLSQQDSSLPITFGYNFRILISGGYHSGGAGYVLSREALKRFYQGYHEVDSLCAKNGPNEDLRIAACLRSQGVYAGRSIDHKNRERFHPLSFSTHYFGPLPDWLKNYARHKPALGMNCCSDTTISFHHVTPEEQIFIDQMRYGFRHQALH